ncbi:DUF5919 domain-containing protein [Nocardia lijiangensis]|uniref:DUF5919 domain-containing protein n=1 Tax=Nocardia lijiangensis TaxID=299618 RepID=UPI000835FC6A|nr:DUF5919 domain-containing protein [Nocardia lijiangensis]
MANERLRTALLQNGLTPQSAAESLGVDAKTVERWITKERVPYPKHRYALTALLHESEDYLWPEAAPRRQFADVEAVYTTRAEFTQAMPPRQLFEGATTIDMSGLSLNLLCQQYSDNDLLKLVAAGTTIRCLFLDPDGKHIRAREEEEGHNTGVLTSLTEINIRSLIRLQNKISARSTGAILIRTYDEPVRFNITVIDKKTCITQPYLPSARGVESPTFVARRTDQPGIFDTFAQVFESMWSTGKEVAAE